MDGVSLKDALAIAARYTDPKATDRFMHVVVLRKGFVRATNYISGCEIPCPDVADIDMAVDCAALRRMVGAVGSTAKLSTAKGRKLVVKGAGVEYKLQAIPKGSEPTFIQAPEGPWEDVTKKQMVALSQISSVVDTKSNQPAFQGMRLTPEWCGAARQNSAAFAWISGLVPEPFTCPPSVFEDMNGPGQLCVEDGKLYIRDTQTAQTRWCLGLEYKWPDDSLSNALIDARGRDRSTATVKLADLALLCRQAGVVAENKAQAFRLESTAEGVTLTGQQGAAAFTGEVPSTDYAPAQEADEHVGVEPGLLAVLCGIVEAAGGEGYCLAVAGPLSPIMVWNHGAEVIIETLTMPMRLE